MLIDFNILPHNFNIYVTLDVLTPKENFSSRMNRQKHSRELKMPYGLWWGFMVT